MSGEEDHVVTIDREALKAWYRTAMARRLDELRGLRTGLRRGDHAAFDRARSVAQALRGSGATYGFAEVTEVAGLVESAPDSAMLRRVEGLIEHLRGLAFDHGSDERIGAEWLVLAATEGSTDVSGGGFPDLPAAWSTISGRYGTDQNELAGRVVELLGLVTADLAAPGRAALRLVPEAFMRSELVLPLTEDSETIVVATSDPTSLTVELQLSRVTGRTPRFAVAPPDTLRAAIDASLDDASSLHSGATRQKPRPPRPGAATDRDRVLVVDDEPSARLLARTLLEGGGYEVEEASDGEEALERLRSSGHVSLVVADLNMPELDGLELIWEIRDEGAWAQIPVIVVTGETDEVLETKLIEEGADDYIRKPLDPRLFLARVAATIRRAEQ